MHLHTEQKFFLSKQPFVLVIFSVNLLVYIIVSLPFLPTVEIFERFAGINDSITRGEIWRLLTPVFFHVNVEHLLFNSLHLFLFGTILSSVLPVPWLFTGYFVSAMAGNLLTWFLAPGEYVHVGSSGAIFGLIGMTSMMIVCHRLNDSFTKPFKVLIPIVIILSFLQPGINPYSHVGGLMSGMGISYLFAKRKNRK